MRNISANSWSLCILYIFIIDFLFPIWMNLRITCGLLLVNVQTKLSHVIIHFRLLFFHNKMLKVLFCKGLYQPACPSHPSYPFSFSSFTLFSPSLLSTLSFSPSLSISEMIYRERKERMKRLIWSVCYQAVRSRECSGECIFNSRRFPQCEA